MSAQWRGYIASAPDAFVVGLISRLCQPLSPVVTGLGIVEERRVALREVVLIKWVKGEPMVNSATFFRCRSRSIDSSCRSTSRTTMVPWLCASTTRCVLSIRRQ